MDTTDPEIKFGDKGVCNHCRQYNITAKKYLFSGKDGERRLQDLFLKVRQSGMNKPYDCIMGLSGGVDSTYVAYIAKKQGLRPLAVHLDNGWNSELAVKNIENIVRKLDLDLYTHVIDWVEFRDLQISFFKAGVIDIEMLTDHAITAILYRLASKHGIKYILSGSNMATEGIMPTSWTHRKSDLRNIKAIHNRYGKEQMKSFPTASTFQIYFWYLLIKRMKSIRVLDYIDYNKEMAMSIIEKELGWKSYGIKHYESIFTRFYQGFILPSKFDVDKRKAHLSTLICSGQISRAEALKEIKKNAYDHEVLASDKDFVLKKLGFGEKQFEEYVKSKPKAHFDYGSDEYFFKVLRVLSEILYTKT